MKIATRGILPLRPFKNSVNEVHLNRNARLTCFREYFALSLRRILHRIGR